MKKIFMVLLALQICLSGFSVGGVSAASDDSIEHEHIWVETSETIHHDAEYAIKTTWFYGLEWYDYYPDGTVPDGPNKYHINYGNSPYGKFEDMYDFTCYYIGGSLENIQEEYIYEWITIDNYENYNLSYDEYVNYFSNYFKDAIGYANIGQNIFGQNDITAERDFNPNYDEIVMISGIPASKAYDEFGKAWHDVELGYTNQKFLDGEDVCNTIYDYYPVAQKEIFIDEYDETLTYHVCEICGESYTTRESNRTPIEVPQPAEDHPLTKLKGATVEIYDFPKTQYELGEELDLTGGIGMVEYSLENIETGEIETSHVPFFFDDDYSDYEDITVTIDASEFNSSVEGVYTIYVTYSDIVIIDGYISVFDVPYTVELSYQVTVGNPNVVTTTQPTTMSTTTTTTEATTETTTTTEPITTSTTNTTSTSTIESTTTSTTTTVKPTTTSTTSTTTTTSTTSTTSTTTTSTSTSTTTTSTTTTSTSTSTSTTSTSTSASSTSATTTQTTTASTTTEPVTTTAEQKYVPVFGDVNCDGEVDIRDVVMLNRYLGGTYELSNQAKVNADCYEPQDINFNPVSANTVEINEEDSMAIMNHIIHLITLPTQETALMSIEMGDVNGDGEFTVADIVTMQNWLLAKPDAHLVNWQMADFNGDNRIDVFDLCIMKRMLLAK